MVFETKGEHGRALPAGWAAWARRSRPPEFAKLAETITRYRDLIHNTLDHRLSNALSEAPDTPHLRPLTRTAQGASTAPTP